MIKRSFVVSALSLVALMSASCTSDVGTKQWCQMMVDKPESKWTVEEAADFVDSCRWWGFHVK